MAEAAGAQYHGKMFLSQTIGKHPSTTAVVLGVLVILTLILIFVAWNYRSKWEQCQAKAGGHFSGLSRSNNLVNGSNNPLWWWGSADAGLYGSVGRDSTKYHVATWDPAWRTARRRSTLMGPSGREGMAPGRMGPMGPMSPTGGSSVQCPPGWQMGPDGYCYYKSDETAPIGPLDQTLCARQVGDWDPSATAEAQALAQVGALNHQDYGERNLMSAVDLAFDAGKSGLSDAQLEGLMHTGGVS